MRRLFERRSALLLFAILLAGLPHPAGAQWISRGQGASIEAGTSVDDRPAGLLLRCRDGAAELALTHNGAVFDRERAHTIVVSVDGTARILLARARPSGRAGDDDFVVEAPGGSLEPLMNDLARGAAVEVSAPSGRYTLPLAGSARALSAFRAACPSG